MTTDDIRAAVSAAIRNQPTTGTARERQAWRLGVLELAEVLSDGFYTTTTTSTE